MTAAEELRRLLDERGTHWWAGEDEQETLWESNGLTWEYSNNENGDAWLGFLGACEQDITPEQAVAATLERERTCTMLRLTDYTCQYMHRYACSECGEFNEQPTVMGESEPPRYCPNCGARVVEVGE